MRIVFFLALIGQLAFGNIFYNKNAFMFGPVLQLHYGKSKWDLNLSLEGSYWHLFKSSAPHNAFHDADSPFGGSINFGGTYHFFDEEISFHSEVGLGAVMVGAGVGPVYHTKHGWGIQESLWMSLVYVGIQAQGRHFGSGNHLLGGGIWEKAPLMLDGRSFWER